MNEQEINDRIDILSDMLIETEKCIEKLTARDEEMQTVLMALMATHPNKKALADMLEHAKTRTRTNAKQPNVPAGDSFVDESKLAVSALTQILEKVQKT